MPDVAPEILDRLRAICGALPEAYEEPAWIGVRWRVRKRTFAHVACLEQGRPGPYEVAARPDRDNTVVTFRASADEVNALGNSGPPFYFAGWGRNVIGIVLDGDTDWDEVSELLTESFCVMAPLKLVARVDRPSGTA